MSDFEILFLHGEFERLSPKNGDALMELAWMRKKDLTLSSWLNAAYKIRARMVEGDMSDLECQDFKNVKKRARGE